jgi:myo-inositol-1(or 4)-monophosphatase
MTPKLSDLEFLARRAGEILRAGYGRQHHIDYKGLIDLVTEVDHQSEAFLLSEIRRSFPAHRILAEESGSQVGEECCIWYVDPLDGTINFAHDFPFFAVSLAFEMEGEMRLGVIYDPLQDECYTAERGKGAWLNGTPIHVSGTQDLLHSLLVTGFPYDIRENPDNNLDHYARLNLLTQGVRRLGSAALDLAYVACGRLDGFWEVRVSPWDVAAGGLIAREAGATVTDMQGNPGYLAPLHSILAANPYVYPLMLAELNRCKGKTELPV